MAKASVKAAAKADPADLAARIRSGGTPLEQLEKWAHDAAPDEKKEE